MRIEAYDFGTMTIDGTTYTEDLKIIGGKVIPGWWRAEGHRLLVSDIRDILEARPEVLIVGTGSPGLMAVSDRVRSRLAELGIDLIAKPTRDACADFNRLADTRPTAFAAHLTC